MKGTPTMNHGGEDVVELITTHLKAYGGSDVTNETIQSFINCLRISNQKLVLQTPRRGAHVENGLWLKAIQKQLAQEAGKAGVAFDAPVKPHGDRREALDRAEKWRELECLAVSPPTFKALKHLPELQQLIAFTAPDAVSGQHFAQAFLATVGCVCEQPEVGILRGSEAGSIEEVLAAASDSEHSQEWAAQVNAEVNLGIVLALSPHLRLALAAEVAAGMLCPGTPAPPDTPEHASILKLYAVMGMQRLKAELKQAAADAAAAAAAGAASSAAASKSSNTGGAGSSSSSRSSKLQRVWAHVPGRLVPEQSGQQPRTQPPRCMQAADTPAGADLLPPASRVRSWPLSPHIDLQLHAPPHLLLQQMVLLAAQLCKDQQQQEEQREAAAAAGSDGREAQHQQQQKEEEEEDEWQQQQRRQRQQLEHQHSMLLHRALQQLQQQPEQQGGSRSISKAWATLLSESDLVQQLQSAFTVGSANSAIGRGGRGGGGTWLAPGGAAQAAANQAAVSAPDGASSATQAVPEAAGPAAQAAAQARDRGTISMLQQLCEAATSMAARCLVEQVLQGNQQQALPLQALQLQAAVKQLQTTAQAASSLAGAALAAAVGADAAGDEGALLHVLQQGITQLLVQQALALVQLVRAVEDAAAAAAAASNSPQVHTSSSWAQGGSSSCGSVGGGDGAAGSKARELLAPSEFFAADGPLSSSWGCREPPAGVLGLWQADAAAPSAAGFQGQAQAAAGTEAAGAASMQALHQQEQQEQLTSQVLLAAALCHEHLGHVSRELGQVLQHKLVLDAVRANGELTTGTKQRRTLLDGVQLDRDAAWLRQAGLSCATALLQHLSALPEVLAGVVSQLRAALCQRHGLPPYSATAWQAQLGSQVFADRAPAGAEQDSGSSDAGSDDWDAVGEEGEDPAHAAQAGWGSGPSSSSGGGYPGQWQSPEAVQTTQQLARIIILMSLPRGCGLQQSDMQRVGVTIRQGAASLRQLAGSVASKFVPLQQWHAQHVVRQQQAAVRAQEWWQSRQRLEAAVAGATGKPLRSAGTKGGSSSSSRSGKSAAAAYAAEADSSGSRSRSSRGSELWPRGLHDHNPECPLCAEEQQHATAQLGTSTPSSSTTTTSSSGGNGSVYAAWPVSYDDPFMWRRLMWQLLGKLSPEAQAFYATYLAMCPHCTDARWWGRIGASISRCLGVPVGPDVAHLTLLSLDSGLHNGDSTAQRERFMRQYGRAINTTHAKAYHPCTPLLAKQVLLALSPLHHQLLPPPEVAHLLPSSFVPAVGKALMQQVMPQSVLAGFAHKDARVQPWHVFWHVGLRRHHWLRQQQQAQQQQAQQQWAQLHKQQGKQQKLEQRSTQGSESSSGAAVVLPDQAYLDADARLYAVGFATRQLLAYTSACSSNSGRASGMHQGATCAAYTYGLLRDLTHQGLAAGSSSAPQGPSSSSSSKAQPEAAELNRRILLELFALDRVLLPGMPVLDDVLGGPADPLVPLQQQLRLSKPLGRQSSAMRQQHLFGRRAAEAYVQLGDPAAVEEMQRQHRQRIAAKMQLQEGEGRTEQEAQQQRQQQQQLRGATDSTDLLLAPPAPVECLLPPEVWWGWQKRVLGIDRCDTCGKHCTAGQVHTCAVCESCVYCSAACRAGDEQHALICEKLTAVQQRYSPRASSSGSEHGSSPALLQQQSVLAPPLVLLPGLPLLSSLLQPSAHEPGPLGPWQDWPAVYTSQGYPDLEQVMALLADAVASPKHRSRAA